MYYNLCYVGDQILAPEFYFPCADFIYICKQPDYSEQNLNPYATFTIHIYHIQFKITQLSKYELGFQNLTFQLWSDTGKWMLHCKTSSWSGYDAVSLGKKSPTFQRVTVTSYLGSRPWRWRHYNPWNFYNYTSHDTASHPKRPKFSSSWISEYN